MVASEHLVNATHTKINPGVFARPDLADLADVFRPRGTQIAAGDRLADSAVYGRLVRTLKLIAEQARTHFQCLLLTYYKTLHITPLIEEPCI